MTIHSRPAPVGKISVFVGAPLPAVDMLTEAIEHVRVDLDRALPVGQRARTFWAAVAAARDFGTDDVVEREFVDLARATGLTDDLIDGATIINHLVRWGLLDRNPFK